MSTYFRTIPDDIEASARIDGCSTSRILWNIIGGLTAGAIK